ncbi:PREDICTED: ceramide glucosyltransferase [Ceratosolen solmsi marchali]|uniref:ceramide glucosyltransferase n=1 Tax=Ceratosolen solmsi marchali TaxID=326594 RepID=A0AAJ6YKV6_9HYME|nr:PREDICTED: ceramide glucosyltransferase [Ceratosolen solmsi marchali]
MNLMVYTLYGFAVTFMVIWSVMWIFHVLALIAGRWKLHRKLSQVPTYETPLPGVSIIKPLMGVDPNLHSNLETFFQLDYPVYELLFCIEDEQDPVLVLVHKLVEKYPAVEAKLFIGGRGVGVNPKINNMQPAYEASRHELILISDSGIRMREDTLLDMVNYMTERVGLVHQMPFTCDREGFAAAYEKIYFGTVQSRMYLVADLLRINCHTGMSALIKKALLEEVGGLKTFGAYLAEDFFYAKSLMDRNWRITVCSQPAMQNSGHCEVYSFQARLKRWAKLRVAMLPTTIVLEPLSECLILGACASWAANLLLDWDTLVFYLAHVLLWFTFDWTLLCVVQNGPLPFNFLEFVIGWLLCETTRPYLFVQAVLDPLIQWRSRVYRLKWGGLAEEVKAKVKY